MKPIQSNSNARLATARRAPLGSGSGLDDFVSLASTPWRRGPGRGGAVRLDRASGPSPRSYLAGRESHRASAPAPGGGSARRAAFTLVELLAVIVVLALFMSLQLCALARAKGQDRVTQCASNLRQFTLATILYANENNDKLPNNASVGFWAWDIPWKAGDELGKYGADWKVLYCPGTAPRFNATDNLNLYNYGPIIYHVIGYATTFPNTLTVSSTNWNSSLTSPATTASKRVLLADATISQAGQYSYSQRLTYNWTSINGGYPSAHISPHLNGAIPSGGNQSMLDGHVEWRPFDDMRCRVTGSSPGFWW